LDIDSELKKVECLLGALAWCSDQHQYDALLSMIRQTLEPYVRDSHPRALWLKSGMPNLGLDAVLSEEDFLSEYTELVRLAAEGGCPEAQYKYGCNLYDEGKVEAAVNLFYQATQADYAPAQWCYGLDVLNGNGINQNEREGLAYIRLAAEQRYEDAVAFLIDAYQEKEYGFDDEAELRKWKAILPHCE
jgi:TPR repeat protein